MGLVHLGVAIGDMLGCKQRNRIAACHRDANVMDGNAVDQNTSGYGGTVDFE